MPRAARVLTGRPLFLVFEPTNHLWQVIPAADRHGYDVVVFHTLPILTSGPYAPGVASIALAHRMSGWDDVDDCLAEVLKVCAGRQVAGAYAAQEITLELEARVQEEFGLPTKGSAAVRELLNKATVRRRLRDAGLSRLRSFEQSELDQMRSWPVGDRALYFKPVHGAGSACVTRCRSLAEVKLAAVDWAAADERSLPVLGPYLDLNGGAFFLDEEATGELLSVEGYTYQGRFRSIGLTSRLVLKRNVAVEVGWTFPYQHPLGDEIVAAVTRMHEVLGVRHGPTHTEVMVSDDGDVELVEMNIRFTGTDSLAAINLSYGVMFEDDLVALATGAEPSLPLHRQCFASRNHILAPTGLDRIETLEIPERDLAFLKVTRPPGSVLHSTDRQFDYIASFIVGGATHEEAVARAYDVRRRTLVNGRPIPDDDPNNVFSGR